MVTRARRRAAVGLRLVTRRMRGGYTSSDRGVRGVVQDRWMCSAALEAQPDALVEYGRRLRRARARSRKSQRDVAASVGISQSTLSRMESGRGGGIGFGIWLEVARVVGLDLAQADPAPTTFGRVAIARL